MEGVTRGMFKNQAEVHVKIAKHKWKIRLAFAYLLLR